MRMTIERMKLENFKGVKDLSINFAHTTQISGMNGTGKTTIPDAFSWVLWNKDSHGNAPGSYDFREKPLDENGEEIHNLDTTVELFCKLDGQPFNLRRTQRENWVKKRGNNEAVYQGNVSTYWINEVETKLTDFKARIAQIADEEVFRLIGSLSAFNALDWKKRREQLIALSDIDVDAMLLQRSEYRALADECAQRGVEVDDLKKILQDQRKRANDELRMIPVRIDEARKALPDFGPNEIDDAEREINDAQLDIEAINAAIAEAKASDGQTSNRERILAIEMEAVGLQRIISDAHRAEVKRYENERDMASEAYRRHGQALADYTRAAEIGAKQLQTAEAERDRLRVAYSAAYEARYNEPQGDTACPTCGQELPQETVQAARDKALADFEAQKAARLRDIKDKGIKAASEVSRLKDAIAQAEADKEAAAKRVESAALEQHQANEQLRGLPSEPDYTKEPRIAELTEQASKLRSEQQTSPDAKIRDYEARKAELQAEVKAKQAVLARRDAGKETQRRIDELEQQQKTNAARVAEVEQLIALTEEFIQDRSRALEDSINNHFPTVRWRLFEQQINGGIAEVCQAFVPGSSGLVSYGTANTAAQINADIEIVNVLSRHYGVSIPLFADNSERVNRLADTDAQLISLAVSTEPKLTVTAVKEGI